MNPEVISMELGVEDKKSVALSEAGVNRKLIYGVLKEGLLASKVRIDVDENGDTIQIEEPDHSTRHKFLDTALRVMGDLKGDAMIDNRKVSINMGGVNKEEVSKMMDMVKDVRDQLDGLKGSGSQTGEVKSNGIV